MIVVSDTSPLNYLVLTNLDELLPKLFGKIIIPEAVHRELSAQGAPEILRSWLSRPHPWLEIRPARQVDDVLRALDLGESEVIALAEQLGADLVLIDEARGRKLAAERGLKVAGILGILDRAAKRGLVNLTEAIDSLKTTTFRVSPKLLQSFRER